MFTRDNAGHLLLWLIIYALVEWPLWIAGGAFDWSWASLPAPIAATLALFHRELIQVQATKFNHNFLKGWPWHHYANRRPVWDLHKHMEWIAPSVGGSAIKVALSWVI